MRHCLSALRWVAMFGLTLMLSAIIGVSCASTETQGAPETIHPVASHDAATIKDMSPESQCENDPLLVAEGSNSCEIVSCGAGIKDTCKITCPKGKTPKCSCDCIRNVGPLCMEYKAMCKCQ